MRFSSRLGWIISKVMVINDCGNRSVILFLLSLCIGIKFVGYSKLIGGI